MDRRSVHKNSGWRNRATVDSDAISYQFNSWKIRHIGTEQTSISGRKYAFSWRYSDLSQEGPIPTSNLPFDSL